MVDKYESDSFDPQIDYAYSNEELRSREDRNQNALKTIKGLIHHVAKEFTKAGFKMAEKAPVEKDVFNANLNIPNLFKDTKEI